MADKVIRVPVVAEFQTDLRSLQDIEKALSGAFEKAGTGTAIAKGLKDSLTKIRPLLKEYEQLQIQPTIDQAGVRRMNTIFDSIIREYSKRASQIEFADPEAMLPEEVLTRIRAMRTEVASLKKEMEAIQRHGASGKSDDYFQRREATAAQQDLHRRAKEALPSKYSGDATLQQNASVVEKEATAAAQRAAALAEQGRKLAEALKQAEAGIEEAQTALWQATGELQTATVREGKAQKAANASKFYTALGGLTVSKTKEHAIVGGAGLRQSAFVDQSGKLQTEFQTLLRSVLQETGIEIDASRLIAESNASEIPEKIRQAIVDVLGDSEEAITQVLEEFKARAQQRLTRVDTEGFANADQFLKSAREQRRTAQTTYDRAQQKAKEAPEKAFAIGYQIEENDDAQREAQETAAALQTLSVALKEVAAAAKEAAVAAKKSEAEDKEREVRETTEKERNKIAQPLESTNKNLGPARDNHQEGNRKQSGVFSQESNAQQEAESFQQSMKNAVKQWFSIQQIINIVKQGIRQAYQDIQGLDKAMTNIAVVTDMSVSDLWGKINEYMSIAQQYGVTTQGVYEVSQLYYQQGLSTNEVMEATTETLKLARIAGMGYAEAADAMTVAIRSFKMEMSDAATVTDVYSKVAAITASDSEELAIAMSKTASSAESVGSSFENTTAMLAVMIETTRESAQNLGSALKSIISRYGEMKVGLSVDSEGEEIDYNKVDTALKSVGISIKDAQGQFRDFDDVIFELSEKWDSLDKNTQRYIATIMAGNRQQSRFIALVDNWERLDEVTKAAADSQDAGLLQYSKTLDSLETKLTNIKTSFQQFYMSIINGPVVGFFLELGNSILQAFNKLGALQSIFNVLTWIRTIKMIANLIFKGFEGPIAKIVTSYRRRLQEMTRLTGSEAFKAGQIYAKQFESGMNSRPDGRVARRMRDGGYEGLDDDDLFSWGKHSKAGRIIDIGGQLLGTTLSTISMATANSNAAASTWTGIGGNIASMASMGAELGPWGAAAGALLGAVTSLHEVADIQEKQAQIDYENAQKAADEANIKRAETKNSSDNLKSLIEQYKQAEATKNDSQEKYDNWLSINQQLADMYPALISYMDEEGHAIVNITEASLLLEDAFKKTTSATLDYYNKEILKRRAENAAYGETNFEAPVTWTRLWDANADNKAFFVNLINNNGEMPDYWYEAGERAKGLVGANQNVSVADMVAVLGDLQEYVRYLQGVDSDKFFTSNDKTYINNGRGMGYDAEYMSRIMIELGIIQYDELSGAYTLSDAVQKYDPNFETNPELLGMLQARSLAHLSNLSNESFYDDSLARITGFNGFLYNYLHEIQNISDDQIALLTEVDYNDYLRPISNFFSQLSTVNQALFENLISDYTNYSYSYVNDILTKLRVPDDIKQTILEGWTQNNSGWQSRLLNQGVIETGQSSSIGQILTYEAFNKNWEAGLFEGTFMANHENPATAYQAYLQWQALKLGEDYVLLIQNLTGQAAIDFSNWIKAEKEKQNASGKSGEIAGNRYNWIFETYANSYAEDGFLAELSSKAQQEFRTLLITDAGSSEWAQKIQDFVEKYDIDVEGIESIESYIFENLGIRATQFNDSVNSYIEKLDNLTKKQDKGYTSSEAQALAELRELALMDLFEVNEEGLLVLRDLHAEQARVLEEELAKNSRLKEKYTTARAFFQDNAIEGKSFTKRELVEDAIGADTVEETLGWLTASFDDVGLNLDPELAEQLATEIHNGTITSYDQFIAYLDKQLELLQITEEQYNKATAALQNEQDRVKFSEKYQADISAVGLDKIFNGTLINAEGVFTASWGQVNEAGELLITDYEGLIAALTAILGENSELIDYWTKQIQDYQIKKDQEKFNETYNVSVSATGLDTVFGGTLIDAEGVFNADWASVDAAGNLLINDYEALLDALAEVLGEDSEAFRAWRKAIIAQSADVEKDVNKAFVDVISKMQLAEEYGLQRVQLTNEEVRTLYESYANSAENPDDFDAWADYHGFYQTGTGYEFETAWANGDWNGGYTWGEYFYTDDGLGISGALDIATTTALYEAKADLIKTIEGLSLDSDYSSVKKFFDAGILTEEQYQAFFTSGQTAYEYLMSILSQSANEEIQAAVKKAKDAVELEQAIELDSNQLTLEDNFTNLFGNITETSLKDIQSIYEQIYGEDSFTPEIAARYQTALDQAREGTVQPLINLLYELANMANSSDKGFEVDTARLNSAYKDANNSLVSGLAQSLSSGISGTLSNIDFDNLIEQIGGVPKDYRRFVIETYDGLKLSAEGALVIASKLIDEFGNASLVAESLVEQLGGSGALGSYKDVDDLINEIVTDTNHWAHGNEDILNLLYQMRAQYSQLAEDARFDFMNQDHFGGAADNWYTLTDNISTAIDTLKSAFEKGGKIDYKSFDNIITWISDLSVDGLDTKLGETGVTLGQFTEAVLATVDATGNLDLSAAAANLGISMDDMAGALEGGLQEVAKQQVAYWKKYLDFLKGLKELQNAQDEVSLHIPIQNEVDGTWTYKGNTYDSWEALMAAYGGNLGMDLAAAQQFFNNFTYTGENGTTITLSGKNNPLNFILGELDAFEPDGTLKAGMEQKIGQYIGQVFAWINTISEQDIDQYINEDTGEITIPWSEILQIELDTSTTPEVNTTNAGEAGEQTQDAAEGAAESALTASGATPNGDGSYTYTLDDMTLKIQMGANGSVEIDLTNATGTLPSAAELRKVFEGQEGFTATDDNNWVFTDPNLGFSVKCSNGTLSFDTSGMTAPAAPTAAELSAILGTTWTTADGGKTYTTNLNGVSFVYNSATGKININASSFQLTGGLDATSLAAILGGTWTTNDNGATYIATIAGTSFVYESSSGLVKIDGSKFTLSGGLSATELATILGGSWSSPDGGITYESTINGVTFTYKSASGTVEIDSSKFTLSAGLSTEQLTTLLGGAWSSEDGITYKSVISGVTFTYESTTGTISVDPSGFTVSANLTADQLKTLLGGTWTSEDGITYKSTINGATFTYESTTGKLIVTPPTTATEPAATDFVALMQAQGWTHENGIYTKNFSGGALTYNATAGTLTITPSATMTAANPDMATLLDSAFGAGGWQPNENGGYDILNATTGEVLYTLPAKITVTPTAGSNVTSGDNGLTADVDVTLTPNTNLIDDALAAYNNQPIKISLELTNNKNSLLNSPAYNDLVAKTRAYLDKNLSYDEMETTYYQAYQAFSPYIPTMSREDLLALQELQSYIDFGLFINEGIEDPWWTALGEKVSAALEALPEEGELTGITSLFNSLSSENLAANLLGITSLFSTLVSPELATLDLTNFIAQLQSLGELELDDEEIEKLTVVALALTEALTPLANATVNPVIIIDNTQAISAIDEIEKALEELQVPKTITISIVPSYSGEPGLWSGNVNGIAYAEGNFNKLIAGAHLANKTLVGELGPELAVYNNQYHLLGRDGAEFVNLPSDAIVFNHRQTEGIIKGQTGYRGKALVNGNVSGPAAAGGIDAAIAAVDNIIALWSNLLDQSVSDLLANSGGGGGGGGGNELKAVTAELQEWYNLTRRIAYEEQEINNLIAERNNILDGGDYLKNLRETEKHLKSQRVLQSQLLDYQTQQLQRQADFINDHDIWSKYLYIDENGLLQYINGNETNGGKGALEILESFNKMSGEEQQKYLKSVNYSFTDQDGKDLEGSELAEKFLEQLQAQIDQYDELYDTVHSTEETIEGINSNIKEINEEIKQNQMDLEQAIYEIIESAWEKEIEQLEKQVELIEEANNAYIKGLQDALNAEKEAYSDNQSIEEREALQRQLSLLRRSGGSASEIADLEKQLDDTLKDEYFRNQEKMIENIEEANENQIKLLEKQITLQEEALAFEKENGVLWTKVYEVMSRSEAEILEFMQGNHTDFFSQSLLQQEEMLTDWAKKIGIYSEDRQYQNHIDTATSIWNSQGFWNSNTLKGLQNTYNQLSSEGQSDLRDIFSTTYAQEIMAGSDVDNARLKAEEEVKTYLNKYQKENSSQNTESSGNNSGNSGLNYSKLYYGGYTKNHTFIGGENCYADGLAKAKELARGKGIEVDKGNDWFRTGSSPVKAWRKWYVAKGDKKLTQDYSTKSQAENARISGISGNYNNYVNAQRSGADAATVAKLKQIYEDFNSSDIKFFSTGGLVDYTGLAMVHGSKSRPESFLNASQTAQIKEALEATNGKENLLQGLHSTIDELRSLIHNISTINNSINNNITIAPGAVVINVDQLADSYDVDTLSADIMNRMVSIASKATNRGVNRR